MPRHTRAVRACKALLPLIAALACNLPISGRTTPAMPTATPSPGPTASPLPSATAAPTFIPADTPLPHTPTPLLAVTVTSPPPTIAPRNCRDDAQFIGDISVPDATEFDAGAPFTKTWRVQNTGTCPWTDEYALQFIGGDQMGGPDSLPIADDVLPGMYYNVSIKLVAPPASGIYSGLWRLRNPPGELFGTNDAPLTVVIVVR